MKIHCLAVILVTLAGTLFQITASEWCVCLLLFALVASLELVNTAIEAAKTGQGYSGRGSAFLCDHIRDRGMHYFPSIPIGTGGEVVIQ